ncbi:hypothetical protein B0A58_15465 [Flavobacterium branchiophilum NBRC 15030 = ATCC 35035]|uniref:Thiazole/oxazole-forming peptide maturase SagD family component n=1 Tax=Flavobacterium branchiophilum TaxID=55197 RepID=A0A543G4U4_9FLAO|nr:YcaO-like family protein [Flavobacterium branchiophilum]OXA69333.1 hypothetical protein B0A58_15465 [Flavobacterium branchiophilum NBRC 15030 = ATCC 35035]TQM41101.1 thiazole/oxazole-forming peptide maturase SagD family component [Flavobacterium branchiophilum]GEM55588.1 hypothetical protein FB1_18090 [Flavobacterium branchiophilum NBRC 15030 = ATCC 35035]
MKPKIYGNSSFVNYPYMRVAKNIFMPKRLKERVFFANNLYTIGNNKEDITGGGISFDENEAYLSAMGEFSERYSTSFQLYKGLIKGSYNELSKEYRCFNPQDIKYFSEKQYESPNFKLNRLSNEREIHWSKCVDYFSEEEVLLPFFMVNVENIKEDGMFHYNTTTGSASHSTIEKSLISGFLECVERDAFSKFWYGQNFQAYRKFSSTFILEMFSDDEIIDELFNNNKIKFSIYDISEHSHCPTFVVFISFIINDRVYNSVGSASRFTQKEALIKATIEAYQGIEYTKLVCEEIKFPESIENGTDFSFMNSFRKHYAFYNVFPELIKNSPLLLDAYNFEFNYSENWIDNYSHHIKKFNKEELLKAGLNKVYYTNLTTVDVRQLGIEVTKIVTPQLHLLTGNHCYPYLGLFNDNKNLFTTYPHPFP